ncbi:disease resistance protein Roq1-like [Rutidosis leptorrhynchoides]|uniref:disease resistance protein Roq1-like n=1 Tax=Rutidosis leptorrhynchoides TaxID=125765 RepID=UPI003A9975DE
MDNHESKLGKDSEKVKRWKKALSEAGSLSGWELKDRYQIKESADDDVLMIGLWGPGGLGKTAIAKALYNAMMRQFQVCSFLEQVREKSHQSGGLVSLQKDLLSEILVHPLTVYSVTGGISLIQERLCCKKVLLVLDDVDHMNQLNALAGKGNWFGKGSIIIVTTRNKQLLTSHGINRVHRIQTLGCCEARDLFCLHAFPDSESVEIGVDLIDRALPAWESALHKLSKRPDQSINQVLKTSFDGLENNEREIFLDILMGKDIVNEEWPDDPRKRSRLWLFEDVEEVLYEDTVKGNGCSKGHSIELGYTKEMTISPCAFKKMKRLRMLILHKVHISSQGPVRLPNALRWLEWPNALHLEFGAGPKKLARLRFQNSHIKQLVGNCQNFICLKSIEFRDCKSLASIPDISSAPLLESLDLFSCKSLVEVHQSVGDLDKLKHLNRSSCSSLRIFPNTLKTKSLQWLDFSGCSKLEKCPDILEKMEHLIYFFS